MAASLPPLRAGDLRHKIEIWRKVAADDGRGGRTSAWTKMSCPWAEVLGQAGREALVSQALQSVSVYRIRVRGFIDLRDDDQVRYGTIVLNVKSVSDPNGDGEQKVIFTDNQAVEALPDG
jgi:SPP1 family predicted phage head-tail adaptor